MPTSAAATSQDWSMTSQLKTASIMPTLNATEPWRVSAQSTWKKSQAFEDPAGGGGADPVAEAA
jgi:hypothetical protein